jgi:hypothetical protein
MAPLKPRDIREIRVRLQLRSNLRMEGAAHEPPGQWRYLLVGEKF